ncbi:MAG: bifunctional ADP-dependent NAD(P)H-hydrate dehydratase/NAD(P)H-hydrate epimerase, partial [Pseudomonadota bacterium]
MQALPELVYPVAAVRDVDRAAIEEQGIPGYSLMSRAAGAALELAQERFPAAGRWLFIAGPGNNG